MTHPAPTHRLVGGAFLAFAMTAAWVLTLGGPALAAGVPSVALATAADYAVLGATTVTNTGNSVLDGSLGLSPGGSISGFPPGLVLPPSTTNTANAEALQAQSDLTAAYVDAAGRPVTATTTADLANLHLQAGVYAGPAKSALGLTGPLVLDGAGDLTSVFIFQTDSTLITGSGSTVSLVNGAQECNVFWQVGSSATLGTASVFAGNVMALTSITVNNGATVHGRALARNGAVTLDNDTFSRPTCAVVSSGATTTAVPTTTSSVPGTTSTSTVPITTSTAPGGDVTVATTTAGPSGGPSATSDGGSLGTAPSDTTSTAITRQFSDSGLTSQGLGSPDVPRVVGPPRTGAGPLEPKSNRPATAIFAGLLAAAVTLALGLRGGMRPRSDATSRLH
jgi:hypothetical protein